MPRTLSLYLKNRLFGIPYPSSHACGNIPRPNILFLCCQASYSTKWCPQLLVTGGAENLATPNTSSNTRDCNELIHALHMYTALKCPITCLLIGPRDSRVPV